MYYAHHRNEKPQTAHIFSTWYFRSEALNAQ